MTHPIEGRRTYKRFKPPLTRRRRAGLPELDAVALLAAVLVAAVLWVVVGERALPFESRRLFTALSPRFIESIA
jgi:hypothetical protein